MTEETIVKAREMTWQVVQFNDSGKLVVGIILDDKQLGVQDVRYAIWFEDREAVKDFLKQVAGAQDVLDAKEKRTFDA